MPTPTPAAPGHEISTILRHDAKRNTYKIALLRAINDVVTGFPDLAADGRDVAVPLRTLAARWVAYFWPFADPSAPVWQGARTERTSDVAFRSHLEALRAAWEATNGTARASDGFFLADAMRVPRRRARLAPALVRSFDAAVRRIADTIGKNPVRYAGPGEYSVFEQPRRFADLDGRSTSIPGTGPADACIVVRAGLWAAFDALSLWVEALCIHEWSLFAGGFNEGTADRGEVFRQLTARPDNRVSLSWERNGVDVLMMEGHAFTCPWTARRLRQPDDYDLDHLLPLAVYPVNDLWNLVPADRAFNHRKRDRLPSDAKLDEATPRIADAYGRYLASDALGGLLRQGVALRFARVDAGRPAEMADAAARFIRHVTATRNVATF